jgi:hypothetical protein
VSDSCCKRGANQPGQADAQAAAAGPRKRVQRLWQPGALFHVTRRYPRKRDVPAVDRLVGILRRGLLAPAACAEGLVSSDLNIIADGTAIPYNSLVFLHRFGPVSHIYTICDPGRFAVFVDPTLPVITQEDMGPDWCVLCQDEVYVRDAVGVDKLLGIAIHPEDADSILRQLESEFRRAQLPLYDYDINVLWPSE